MEYGCTMSRMKDFDVCIYLINDAQHSALIGMEPNITECLEWFNHFRLVLQLRNFFFSLMQIK